MPGPLQVDLLVPRPATDPVPRHHGHGRGGGEAAAAVDAGQGAAGARGAAGKDGLGTGETFAVLLGWKSQVSGGHPSIFKGDMPFFGWNICVFVGGNPSFFCGETTICLGG